ncbi:MAG: 4Fe-4S dicluster domain-containing protein [Myxococcales bacterium]|nr:4Fe-4S dicluster domain-containing protein [Myxococcales bacterium]
MRIFSHRNRPVHLGPYPLERLARRPGVPEPEPIERRRRTLAIEQPDNSAALANSMRTYIDIMDRMRRGPVAPKPGPIPEDRSARSEHLKAACYYLDASMAGVCDVPRHALLDKPVVNESLARSVSRKYAAGSADNVMAEASVREGRDAWARDQQSTGDLAAHCSSLVILAEYTRKPEVDEPGGPWIAGTQAQRAALRAAEVGAVVSNYLRFLGYDATLHTGTATEVDLDALLLASGLAEVGDAGEVVNPYLGSGFDVVAITTTLELAADGVLAKRSASERWKAHGPGWWLGFGGARAGFQGRLFKDRPFHMGMYPMETVARVDSPTTRIEAEKVQRNPKRADMFLRAAIGDLGEKAKRELENFRMITKSPFGHAMIPVLGGMVPLQYGAEAEDVAPGYDDPAKNSEMVKAALHYMGADMVGICEVPDYAWYSHDIDGSEIEPYHKYGIAILVDQGYETMEGGSGDDWISGAQSMRAYMRAQLVGGVVADQLRRLGFSARGHSVIDQDVLHIPIILLAGLGELARIGELVLNPFVGPRFKSGIITTNMPLKPDKPIDFGLQDFCNKCNKCARECPTSAIPFGDKIMFNGYEIWKPDVEKCARYRITNSAGSMCGRCMKTCPFNLEGVAAERPFLWSAMNLPFTREWIAKLDDKVGNGRINPVKKWWWDIDSDEAGNLIPAQRVNERQLNFREQPTDQKLACYPPELQPKSGDPPTSPDRKRGMDAYRERVTRR